MKTTILYQMWLLTILVAVSAFKSKVFSFALVSRNIPRWRCPYLIHIKSRPFSLYAMKNNGVPDIHGNSKNETYNSASPAPRGFLLPFETINEGASEQPFNDDSLSKSIIPISQADTNTQSTGRTFDRSALLQRRSYYDCSFHCK